MGSRTITLTQMKPATDKAQVNAIKSIQRIRLKKKSEPIITPLALAASKVPELLAKQQNSSAKMQFNSNFRPSTTKEDWRLSAIEPNKDDLPDTEPLGISPDPKLRRFVGTQADMMISAIKQDRLGLPG